MAREAIRIRVGEASYFQCARDRPDLAVASAIVGIQFRPAQCTLEEKEDGRENVGARPGLQLDMLGCALNYTRATKGGSQ
jgi:hypothetical protein